MKKKRIMYIFLIFSLAFAFVLASCTSDEGPEGEEPTAEVLADFDESTAPMDDIMDPVLESIMMGDPSQIPGVTIDPVAGTFSLSGTGYSISGLMTESSTTSSSTVNIDATATFSGLTDGTVTLTGALTMSVIMTTVQSGGTTTISVSMTMSGALASTGGPFTDLSVDMTMSMSGTVGGIQPIPIFDGTITIDGTVYIGEAFFE